MCGRQVLEKSINQHLDSNCRTTGLVGPQAAGVASIFNKASSSKLPSSQPQEPTTRSGNSLKRSSPIKPFSAAKRGKHSASVSRTIAPLAERLRPNTLDEFVGQLHLTDQDSLLRALLTRKDSTQSAIFWGPPGYERFPISASWLVIDSGYRCGKTTLARLFAKNSDAAFKELSATEAGISDLRAVFEEAKGLLSLTGRSGSRCCRIQ